MDNSYALEEEEEEEGPLNNNDVQPLLFEDTGLHDK